MGAQGTATVDFGATPAAEASVAVTGQATILSTSSAEAFLMEDVTGDNDANAHQFAAYSMRPVCTIPSAGVGFTINLLCEIGLATGQFKVRWVWSD